MAYIIENAHVLKGEKRKDICLLIEENRISSARASFKMYKHLRMDAGNYIMTPCHVLLDFNLPLTSTFEQRKAYYLENFIKKGCTTVLTSVHIERERQLLPEFNKIHSALLDCPIDYCIGVRIPATLLTSNFIRKCKREKVPVIFVEVTSSAELAKVPWGWIKEALFPYNCPLVPIFKNHDNNKKLKRVWTEMMDSANIPSLKEEIQESHPLGRPVLEKIGIFPKKSNLHDGGEVSYNFYLKDSETVKMIESELFMKHDSCLLITMHKGKIIRAGKQVSYRPGYGEYVEIKTPSFYQSPT
jgi:hypothetical protein